VSTLHGFAQSPAYKSIPQGKQLPSDCIAHQVTISVTIVLLHEKPHSTKQLDEHPSPLSVLPSSHVSVPTTLLSPHTGVNVLLSHTGKVEVQPGSISQALLHPSFGTVLPSSQASLDAFTPSPQLITQTFGWALVQV
jgi:hypothetical protein